MIAINNRKVEYRRFSDKTLRCSLNLTDISSQFCTVTWCYDSDEELFALSCLVDHIREFYPSIVMKLVMPYVPNARQDRVTADQVFTLKTFARMLNSLRFSEVLVLDPHSDVTPALLDHCRVMSIDDKIDFSSYDALVCPDTSSAKRYFRADLPMIVGSKHRDASGKIDFYELIGDLSTVRSALIRDDICSSGNTLLKAATRLRDAGVKKIDVLVSHLENQAIASPLMQQIDQIYTSDSVFTDSSGKVSVVRRFRVE